MQGLDRVCVEFLPKILEIGRIPEYGILYNTRLFVSRNGELARATRHNLKQWLGRTRWLDLSILKLILRNIQHTHTLKRN